MKLNILVISFLFIASVAFSQDQLYKKDNTKLEVNVLEINPNEIKYTLFSNPSGPLYIVSKSEVSLVIYKNGQHETFNTTSDKKEKSEKNNTEIPTQTTSNYARMIDEVKKPDNSLFYSITETFNTGLGISYWRELLNNTIDIHLPFAFTFGEPYAYNSIFGNYPSYSQNVYNYKVTRKVYDFGFGVYLNTAPKRAITHFIGPMIRSTQYNGTYQTNFFLEPGNGYVQGQTTGPVPIYYINRGFVLNETYLLLNNGILFRMNEKFNIMLNLAFGRVAGRRYVANDPEKYQPESVYGYDYYSYRRTTFLQFGFNLGYRF